MTCKALSTDPDLLGVEAALLRAAVNALALARRTGTPCYVGQDGKGVDIAAHPSWPSDPHVFEIPIWD